MRIAISLIWLHHNACGGVESYTRNILDALMLSEEKNEYYLLCTRDNYESFQSYTKDNRFKVIKCKLNSYDTLSILLYESFCLDSLVSRLKAEMCFVPCYRMPMIIHRNRYVVVIHDLICLHYPEFFSRKRLLWLEWGNKQACRVAKRIVAITGFVAQDIKKSFGTSRNRIKVIYNPILPSFHFEPFQTVEKEYGIESGAYFYTVSSFGKNKNLLTLLRLMRLFQSKGQNDKKLVISGIGLSQNDSDNSDKNEIFSYIRDNNLAESCILTGFVSNERRNSLMKNASFFLFPSVFEGFGMPPIEAMELGTRVITTRCASLEEVTRGRAIYVNDPYDVVEWYDTIISHCDDMPEIVHFSEYEPETVVHMYLDLFESLSLRN